MRIFLALWLSVLCVTTAYAQTTTIYDNKGNRQGSISRQGSRDVVRDKNGNVRSYYEQQGSETIHRDANGNRLGSSRP
jgi:hypothetical protein